MTDLKAIIIMPTLNAMHPKVGQFYYNPFIREHVYENRCLEPEELNEIADRVFCNPRLPRRPSIRMIDPKDLEAPLEDLPTEPTEADDGNPEVEKVSNEAVFPGAVESNPIEKNDPKPLADDAGDKKEIELTDEAWALAQVEGVDVSEIKGTGVNGRILKKDVEAVIATMAMT